MSNQERARILFMQVFKVDFDQTGEKSWCNEQAKEIRAFGWSGSEAVGAFKFLTRVGLLDTSGTFYGLSDLGMEACVDASIRERAFADTPLGRSAPAVTVGVAHGPVQVGDGNTVNVTYSTVLQSLAQTIEKAADIPAEEKASILKSLGAIIESKTVQKILDVTVAAGAAQYLKGKLEGH